MSSPNTISFSFAQNLQQSVGGGIPGATSYFIARVKYVLLDNSDQDKFTRLGGWKSIGTIECVPFINFNDSRTDPIIARPLRSNYTQYPLINEMVIVKILVSKKAQNNLGNYDPEFYYTDIISVWNAPEHNAVPDASFFKENPNSASVTGKFISNGDLRRLIKAPGDFTVEGRRGGSLRLGSNSTGFTTPWVASSPKPILILGNNPEKVASSDARFENINKDGSTLMMMSGHNVGFIPASSNFDSYNTSVSIPEKQNYVVADQKPNATEALAVEDRKAVPTEVTSSIAVTNPTPPTVKTDAELDEEQMEEREDLIEINEIVDPLEYIAVEKNLQPNIPETKSPVSITASGNLGSLYYYPCSLFNQGDPTWAKYTDGKLDMKKFGCAYTSFSMLATNKKSSGLYTPEWFWENAKKSINVYWSEMAKVIGLTGTLKQTRSMSDVDAVLKTRPLAFEWVNAYSIGTSYKSAYTIGTQHWMVISGKNTDGTYTIFDPGGGKIRKSQKREAIESGLNRIFYFN